MRTVSTLMNTFLAGDVRTIATCVQVTRTDGTVWGFTDHDSDLVIGSVTYKSNSGYTASAIESSNDLSTSNLELDGIFLTSGAVNQSDIEGGKWSNAAVVISLVNYADLSMGSIILTSGLLGQWTVLNGGWKVELRGLAQVMQQTVAKQFTPTCRATFGDSKCTINTTPLTFAGSVASGLANNLSWNDPALTQTAFTANFTDTNGHTIPTASPYQIQIAPPSGSFVANTSVVDGGGRVYNQVTTPSADKQFSVTSGGLYTFASADSAQEVFINYTYAVGYFAFGKLVWLTGANAGLTSLVRTFSPGVVTLALPPPNAIAVGDTYSITAGCDKQYGTCGGRYGNILNFRGEPFIPGPDVILAPQG